MAAWRELENPNLLPVTCRENTAAESMIKTVWFTIWKMAVSTSLIAGGIMEINNF